MRKLRKVLLVLAVALLVFGLVACNKNEDPEVKPIYDADSGLYLREEVTYEKDENGDDIKVSHYYVVDVDDSLESVTVPEMINDIAVKGIDSWAFADCANLKSVVIENGVESIGEKVFRKCSALETIDIPASVTEIGSKAFELCTAVKSFTVASENPKYYSKGGCLMEKLSIAGGIQEIIIHGTTSGIIPDGVSGIGEEAYYGFSLNKIELPSSVLVIGAGAFREVTLEEQAVFAYGSYVAIDERAFLNSNISGLAVGGSILLIGDYAFSGCTELTEFYTDIYSFPVKSLDGLTEIGEYAFSGCSKLDIDIPSSVTSIGKHAFENCTSMEEIEIPATITNIDFLTFENCSGVKKITGSAEVVGEVAKQAKAVSCEIVINGGGEIPDRAFKDCGGITAVTIPDGITAIGNNAFANCSSIGSIVIPDSVTSIEYSAFSGCSSLKSATLPSEITSIENKLFEGCSQLSNVTIPSKVGTIGARAFDGCSELATIAIPDAVETIGDFAFNNCTKLATIAGGGESSKIKIIGRDALTYTAWFEKQANGLVYFDLILCKYKGVMPENTTIKLDYLTTYSISPYAFYGCTGLVCIKIDGDTKDWNDIVKGEQWSGKTSLKEIKCKDSTIRP